MRLCRHVAHPLSCGLKPTLRAWKPRRGFHDLSKGLSSQRLYILSSSAVAGQVSAEWKMDPKTAKTRLRSGKLLRSLHTLSAGLSPQQYGVSSHNPTAPHVRRSVCATFSMI